MKMSNCQIMNKIILQAALSSEYKLCKVQNVVLKPEIVHTTQNQPKEEMHIVEPGFRQASNLNLLLTLKSQHYIINITDIAVWKV